MNLSFNAAGRQHLTNASKIRLVNQGGKLRVRPTNRVSGVNLPKGEKLIDLSGSKATLPEGFDAPEGKYEMHMDKYGWFVMEPGAKGRSAHVTIG